MRSMTGSTFSFSMAVPDEIEDLPARRQPVVVLTAPWHERDTQGVVERLHAPALLPE
jgi:hypothetical protein